MPRSLACSHCGHGLTISQELFDRRVAGKVVTIKCKRCGSPVKIDGRDSPPSRDVRTSLEAPVAKRQLSPIPASPEAMPEASNPPARVRAKQPTVLGIAPSEELSSDRPTDPFAASHAPTPPPPAAEPPPLTPADVLGSQPEAVAEPEVPSPFEAGPASSPFDANEPERPSAAVVTSAPVLPSEPAVKPAPPDQAGPPGPPRRPPAPPSPGSRPQAEPGAPAGIAPAPPPAPNPFLGGALSEASSNPFTAGAISAPAPVPASAPVPPVPLEAAPSVELSIGDPHAAFRSRSGLKVLLAVAGLAALMGGVIFATSNSEEKAVGAQVTVEKATAESSVIGASLPPYRIDERAAKTESTRPAAPKAEAEGTGNEGSGLIQGGGDFAERFKTAADKKGP